MIIWWLFGHNYLVIIWSYLMIIWKWLFVIIWFYSMIIRSELFVIIVIIRWLFGHSYSWLFVIIWYPGKPGYAWLLCHGLWAGPARRDLLFCPSELKDTGRFRNLLLHALLKYSSCPVSPGSISCLPRSGHFFFALPAIYGYRSGKLFGELCCHFPLADKHSRAYCSRASLLQGAFRDGYRAG